MMEHPNIAKVLDAGATESGRPYFVMELVPGIKITDFCDENKLSTRERLGLFIKVCQAIQHAHQKGIIHRDIKPSNVLVTLHDDEPVPKVIDFGIAKATEGRLTDATIYTQLQQFIGTPAYMSPEQARMSGLDIDTRSDIYSLGVLLYELLTGSPPFDEKELRSMGLEAMCQTIREREPVRPSTKLSQTLVAADVRRLKTPASDRPGTEEKVRASARRLLQVRETIVLLRGDLDWIVMKCLEKDRKRRYETANGLAADIERHLNNEPFVARPPSAAYRFQKAWQRNKLMFAATAAVSVVLLLGVVVSTWQAIRADSARAGEATQRVQAQASQKLAEAEQQRAMLLEKTARRRAYAADMNLVQRALELADVGKARRLLDRYRPAPGEEDLRGWEWRYLWKQAQSEALFTLAKRDGPVGGLAASADGKWLADASEEKGITLWNLWTREQVRLNDPRGARPTFSPTQPVVAFRSPAKGGGIRLVNAESLQDVGFMELSGYCPMITFSADGTRLVALADDGAEKRGILVFQVSDGRLLQSIRLPDFGHNGFGRNLALSRSGERAFVGMESGEVVAINLTTGSEDWRRKVSLHEIMSVAASPDGRKVAVGTAAVESSIALLDQANGAELGRLEGHRAWIGRLLFLQNGHLLASGSADQTIRFWDTDQRTLVHVLSGHQSEVWALTSVSDSRLASGSKVGEIVIWDTSSSASERVVASRPAQPGKTWMDFSPDGKALFTMDPETGRIERWGGGGYRNLETVRFSGEPVERVVIEPGGWRLALGTAGGRIEVLDLQSAAPAPALGFGEGTGRPVAFNRLRSGLWVWQSKGAKLEEWIFGETSPRRSLPWSSSGGIDIASNVREGEADWLAGFKSDGRIHMLKESTGEMKQFSAMSESLHCSAMSPGGRWIAVGHEPGWLRVWDISGLASGAEPVQALNMASAMMSYRGITFSPDSRRMVASGAGQMATLWDTESFESVLTLSGTDRLPTRVVFSPDGNALACVGASLHIWTAPTFEEIAAIEAREQAAVRQP